MSSAAGLVKRLHDLAGGERIISDLLGFLHLAISDVASVYCSSKEGLY